MPRVNITVAATAAPEPGKKRGRLKDISGALYQISPALMQMVVPGSVYEIDYKDDSYNGNAFRVIESIGRATGTSTTFTAQLQQPQQVQTPQYGKNIGGISPAAPSTKDEDISVLAIIKSQQLPVGDRAGIFHALRASALAWRDFKKWQRTQDSDMDGDSIE